MTLPELRRQLARTADERSRSPGPAELARPPHFPARVPRRGGRRVGRRMVGLPAVAQAAPAGDGLHGVPLRGMYLTSKNRLAEGRFGTMFKRLPAFAPRDDLLDGLARTMVETGHQRRHHLHRTAPVRWVHVHRAVHRPRHHVGQHAARTAAGGPRRHCQLPEPALRPGLGLRSRAAQEPQFYDPADRDKLLVMPNANGVEDMARDGNGKAIIPEPRNDENLIIVQLHKAVAKFHNRIVDYARLQGIRREWVFETARRLTRWHYQWAVTHDFLPRFVGDGLVGPNGTVYKEVAGKPPVINLNYYRPTNRDGRPFMPVEFAVAAYRFGHSLIRPFYVIKRRRGVVPSSARTAASTSTVGARSRPTWSSSGRTSFRSIRTSRLASRARSTRSCRCRSPAFPDPWFRHLTRRST